MRCSAVLLGLVLVGIGFGLLACDDADSAKVERTQRDAAVHSDGGHASDAGGMDARASQPLPDSGLPPAVIADPTDEAAYIYDQSALRAYELRIAPADLARIDADPQKEEYVAGTLIFEGKEYGPVGVRYKGSVGGFIGCIATGTMPPGVAANAKTCSKLSMKVDFDWQTPAVEFYGLRKLQFHAMNRDPSMLKERLGYTMFRQFGLPAPRSVHARLTINGEFVGLFALVEQIDGRFTRSRFTEGGKGNLYKEAWPVYAATLAVNEAYLRAHLETNKDENPSFAPMLDFSAALQASDVSGLPDTIAEYADVDAIMRYVAVDRTIAHDDGPFHFYCGTGVCANHNFYWYQEAGAPRVWLVVWDLDSSFNLINTTTTISFPWDDTSMQCLPRSYPPALLPMLPPQCDKLGLGLASLQQPYVDAVKEFLAGPFQAEPIEKMLSDWEAQVAPSVDEAAKAHTDAVTVTQWQEATAALRAVIIELRQRAVARVDEGAKDIVDPRAVRDAGSAGGDTDGGS